jgi:aquaporin Z
MKHVAQFRCETLGSELIGTFFLVLTVGINALQGTALAPISIGLVLAVLIFSTGKVSGAHFNPAVTIGIWLVGPQLQSEFTLFDACLYMLAQNCGALLAGCTYWKIFGATFTFQPGRGYAALDVFCLEAFFTAALVLTVLAVAVAERQTRSGNQYGGIAIGFIVMAAAFAIGSVSGCSLNPALSFGVMISNWMHTQGARSGSFAQVATSSGLYYFSLYMCAPFLGAVMAAIIWWMVHGCHHEHPEAVLLEKQSYGGDFEAGREAPPRDATPPPSAASTPRRKQRYHGHGYGGDFDRDFDPTPSSRLGSPSKGPDPDPERAPSPPPMDRSPRSRRGADPESPSHRRETASSPERSHVFAKAPVPRPRRRFPETMSDSPEWAPAPEPPPPVAKAAKPRPPSPVTHKYSLDIDKMPTRDVALEEGPERPPRAPTLVQEWGAEQGLSRAAASEEPTGHQRPTLASHDSDSESRLPISKRPGRPARASRFPSDDWSPTIRPKAAPPPPQPQEHQQQEEPAVAEDDDELQSAEASPPVDLHNRIGEDWGASQGLTRAAPPSRPPPHAPQVDQQQEEQLEQQQEEPPGRRPSTVDFDVDNSPRPTPRPTRPRRPQRQVQSTPSWDMADFDVPSARGPPPPARQRTPEPPPPDEFEEQQDVEPRWPTRTQARQTTPSLVDDKFVLPPRQPQPVKRHFYPEDDTDFNTWPTAPPSARRRDEPPVRRRNSESP